MSCHESTNLRDNCSYNFLRMRTWALAQRRGAQLLLKDIFSRSSPISHQKPPDLCPQANSSYIMPSSKNTYPYYSKQTKSEDQQIEETKDVEVRRTDLECRKDVGAQGTPPPGDYLLFQYLPYFSSCSLCNGQTPESQPGPGVKKKRKTG